MAIVERKRRQEYYIEGNILFEPYGPADSERSIRTTTHATVAAKTAAEAEEAFAKLFVDDVRVTLIRVS